MINDPPSTDHSDGCDPTIRLAIERFLGRSARGQDKARERFIGTLVRMVHGRQRRFDVPKRLGPCEILSLLGKGAMGAVYRARHVATGAAVAIKIVPLDDQVGVEALRHEVQVMAALNHPHLPKVIDFGSDQGFQWLAMEWIDGESLSRIVATRKADDSDIHLDFETRKNGEEKKGVVEPPPATEGEVREAVIWFRDLARALHVLHQKGLVHRDVKPGNIVVDRQGRAVLLDFGLTSTGEERESFGLAGTVPYMSPEQTFGGALPIGAPSDVYALAATCFYVLTRRRTVRSGPHADLIHSIAFESVQRLSSARKGLPTTLDPIFERALQKNPKDRYASAEDLARDLQAWLDGSPLPVAKEKLRHAMARHLMRNRGILSALTVLLIALIAVWGWNARKEQRSRERILSRIEADLTRGSAIVALDDIESAGSALSGDNRFLALWDRAIAGGGEDMLEELLARQTFELKGLSYTARHEKYRRRALFHLTRRPENPALLGVMAFSHLVKNEPARTVDLLLEHREAVSRDSFLRDCLLLCARLAGQEEKALRVFPKLSSSGSRDSATTAAPCMRVLLRCWNLEAGFRPAEKDEDLRTLDAILGLQPRHRLARSLRARILAAVGRYGEALTDYRWLIARDDLTPQQRTAVLILEATCRFRAAVLDRSGIDRAVASVRTQFRMAADKYGASLPALLVGLGRPDGNVAEDYLLVYESVLEDADGRDPIPAPFLENLAILADWVGADESLRGFERVRNVIRASTPLLTHPRLAFPALPATKPARREALSVAVGALAERWGRLVLRHAQVAGDAKDGGLLRSVEAMHPLPDLPRGSRGALAVAYNAVRAALLRARDGRDASAAARAKDICSDILDANPPRGFRPYFEELEKESRSLLESLKGERE